MLTTPTVYNSVIFKQGYKVICDLIVSNYLIIVIIIIVTDYSNYF